MQEEFVGNVFGGRITVVLWLAVVLQRSSLFLSLRSSVSASLRAALLSRFDESLCNRADFKEKGFFVTVGLQSRWLYPIVFHALPGRPEHADAH